MEGGSISMECKGIHVRKILLFDREERQLGQVRMGQQYPLEVRQRPQSHGLPVALES